MARCCAHQCKTRRRLGGRGPVRASLLAALCASTLPAFADDCAAPVVQSASLSQVEEFVQRHHKRVLTFVGYSGAGYQDASGMLATAQGVLKQHDPRHTIVNIGATVDGIGQVYALAKQRGFDTMGVVSSLAKAYPGSLAPCVDIAFLITDARWGGRDPTSGALSPTSAAIVSVSDEVVGIGGGAVAYDELLAACEAGKPVQFHAADMDHAKADAKARKAGLAAAQSYSGAASQLSTDQPGCLQ